MTHTVWLGTDYMRFFRKFELFGFLGVKSDINNGYQLWPSTLARKTVYDHLFTITPLKGLHIRKHDFNNIM